ncbi:hypothetical protein Glove_320g38 [Diversispora epigaea]|uniref:Uncharacterized protein n=1 Tax=Diversispora epigaea TaxID=1348612 RepID=A0A397HS12_9GLOM|nr:hypothetical protein Glove_320g38 [Diversispora epigaea]
MKPTVNETVNISTTPGNESPDDKSSDDENYDESSNDESSNDESYDNESSEDEEVIYFRAVVIPNVKDVLVLLVLFVVGGGLFHTLYYDDIYDYG